MQDYKSLKDNEEEEATATHKPNQTPPNLPSSSFLNLYFFTFGLVGLSTFFIFIAESDFFNDKYPNYLFYFWSVMPANIAVPLSFPMMKFLSCLNPNIGNILTSSIMTLAMVSIVLPPILAPENFLSILSYNFRLLDCAVFDLFVEFV